VRVPEAQTTEGHTIHDPSGDPPDCRVFRLMPGPLKAISSMHAAVNSLKNESADGANFTDFFRGGTRG